MELPRLFSRVPAPVLVVALIACTPQQAPDPEVLAWEARAAGITIIRDDWGIAHIYGATDADAVFGMIYAQAEDDFNRIEVNYLNSMGRLAEAEGEAEIYRDLRMKLFIDPEEMEAQYAASPEWLKALMDAWADGLNYFLHTHPQVKPRVISRFEPWMALTFSEGSIGGDIERVSLFDLEGFYGSPSDAAMNAALPSHTGAAPQLMLAGNAAAVDDERYAEPTGSNGFAIAPANTVNGNALLLINPHTSFYFRSELHMVSEEGLNAYGAVTWGQFFVYQGFNETAGWMHTSTTADNIDEYGYEVSARDDGVYYPYGDAERRLREATITVPYRVADGMAEREFTVYYSHHGPIVREADGRWVAVKLMNEPMSALTQSYTRTKAANYVQYRQIMDLHTNSSNNTVFADGEGNIAYFHSNFVPIRDTRFDWTQPVDGSDPATEWQGLTPVDESPNALNPPEGWIQNTNNWPYSVSGESSPRQQDYPPYMDRRGENARGVHAIRVLDGRTDFTLDSLIDAAYDSYLTAFEPLVPPLLGAYDETPASEPLKAELAEQIELLRGWDLRYGVDSVATALAIFWGDEIMRDAAASARAAGVPVSDYIATRAPARQRLDALAAASKRLTDDFGSWQTPWGEINRFQRLTGDIVQPHDDNAPSIPVAFASGRWGSLASFGASRFNTERLYGTGGNSFVAVVEFGDRLQARAVTAGGESGDPASPHFNDQAERYAAGDLRPVYFYREDVEANRERQYHPGE
ncbi:MAG TPA: penicillin acylase family protein [Acidobacteriota bacterium]|nr:penicillin acylase family protein [Acidobacteriota bacterium]